MSNDAAAAIATELREQCVNSWVRLLLAYRCNLPRYLQNCCCYAAFSKHFSTMTLHIVNILPRMPLIAIYLYDQTITFRDQINYIWSRHFSPVTVMFALLHFSTVAMYMLWIVLVFTTQCQVWLLQLIFIVIMLIVALAVRVSRILDLVLLCSCHFHHYSKCFGCKYTVCTSRPNTGLCRHR